MALIFLAGLVGSLFGAWILNPLWNQNELHAIVAFTMWLVILGLIVALVAVQS